MAARKNKTNLFDVLLYIFLIVFCISVLYPFWSTIVLSFSNPSSASTLGIKAWTDEWHIDAYAFIFTDKRLGYAYINTIFRTVVGTGLLLVLTMMGAYALSKKDLPGRNIITMYFIFTMFFNGGLMPTYLLVRGLGLIDKIWALILPLLINVYYMIIARNYLMSIDKALEESAFIDGASYFVIFTKIIIPISKPIIATLVVWTAVLHWNSWFDALIYERDQKKIVLQLLLRRLLQTTSSEREEMGSFADMMGMHVATPTVRAATILATIGPIVMMYPFLQKYFIKGIMVGSLKG